jgi:predicted nucleic acid-binding protein
MPSRRLKVFLDTSVLVEALRGGRNANALFTSAPEQAATYVVNPVVVQELLLVSAAAETKMDLNELIQHLHVLDTEALLSPEMLVNIREMRNRLAHTNDLLILGAAHDCDFLLTYDQDLLALGDAAGVATRTPEDFLAELGAES